MYFDIACCHLIEVKMPIIASLAKMCLSKKMLSLYSISVVNFKTSVDKETEHVICSLTNFKYTNAILLFYIYNSRVLCLQNLILRSNFLAILHMLYVCITHSPGSLFKTQFSLRYKPFVTILATLVAA